MEEIIKRTNQKPDNKRYLGDELSMTVHDLENEQIGCEIEEIILDGNAVVFTPDSLSLAHEMGYENCVRCLRKRKPLGLRLKLEIDK